MPGQFGHLAAALAREPGNRVVFLTRRHDRELGGVERLTYPAPRPVHSRTHHYLHQFEDGVLHGQATARVGLALAQQGFVPDLIVVHPGWGEGLFLKDVWPDAPILNYGEFYYRPNGADVNFCPETQIDIDAIFKLRSRNAHLLLALEAATHTICATTWQKSLHPRVFHDRISVIHDGIDTDQMRPEPGSRFTLPDGRGLTRDDEVVTFVSRTLEPYRGFHTLMRALPQLCARRPSAQIVIVGGDGPGYGAAPRDGRSWRQTLLDEVPLDASRVHFTGVLDRGDYRRLLQVAAAHVYLTVPFVLSWSMLEAMAAGCLVIGSRTPPVEEVLVDRRNGLLVDFFSPDELAETVAFALDRRDELKPLCQAARETVLRDYSIDVCLPRQRALIASLAG